MTQKEQIKQIIRTLGVIMFTVGVLAVLGTVFSTAADDVFNLFNLDEISDFTFADDVSLTFVVAAGLLMHFGLQLSKIESN